MDFYSRLFADGLSGDGDELFKLAVSGDLTTVTAKMLDGVTSIGDSAFRIFDSLTSVEIPNSVTRIGELAFSYCDSLTSVEIPNSVTRIGKQAFSFCGSLTSIEIPNSVTSVLESAFYGCYKLSSVTVKRTTPPSLGPTVFSSTPSNLKIYVPAESVDAYKAAMNWRDYASKIYAIPS